MKANNFERKIDSIKKLFNIKDKILENLAKRAIKSKKDKLLK
jgi:hypothetical protein